jgi:hypothetical protein
MQHITAENAPSTGVIQRLREQINRHPVKTSLVLIAIVGSLIYFTLRNPRVRTPDGDFIDETTGQTYVMPISAIPPLPGKDGNLTVVRAYYSGPSGDQPRTLLYLQKYSPEAKATLEQFEKGNQLGEPQFTDPHTSVWVCKPEPGSQWVLLDTPEGRAIAPDFGR